MSMIYLVRHGQASFGHDNYDRISDTGIVQSRMLGEYLAGTGMRFDSAYTGPLSRQKATADEVAGCFKKKGLPFPDVSVMKEFNEYDPVAVLTSQIPHVLEDEPSLKIDIENIFADKEAFKQVFEKALLKWVSGRHDAPGVETWGSLVSRVKNGMETIMKAGGRGKTIVVFTSGGPIAAALQTFLGLSNENAIRLNWQIINASMTRFMYNEERITLAGFNAICHLELNGGNTLITYR